MTIQAQTLREAITVDKRSVFVIILKPQSMIDVDVCGLSVTEWTMRAISEYQHKVIDIKRGEDIVALVRSNMDGVVCKYCVVLYADTPLVTNKTIDQALSFTATYSHRIVQLPRGFIFDMHFLSQASEPVMASNLPSEDFTVAYNYRQIAIITSYMQERINNKHMDNGVHIPFPHSTFIEADVKIGKGSFIGQNTFLRGNTVLGEKVKIKNNVEIKNSIIGNGTKIPHFIYVGDAEIGSNCNISCGVIVCNYDGKNKHKTVIGDNVFVGSNSNLVAPLTIHDNSYIACGSTITQDVPSGALAIGRARQAIKENWVTNKQQEEN